MASIVMLAGASICLFSPDSRCKVDKKINSYRYHIIGTSIYNNLTRNIFIQITDYYLYTVYTGAKSMKVKQK